MPRRVRERGAEYGTALRGPIYCDTSALLKLYVPETGSADFNQLVEGRDDLFVSDLTATEIVSGLSRRLRMGMLTHEIARRLQQAIVARLDDGVYRRVELTRDVHRRAEQLLLSRPEMALRAADALHLSLAMSTQAVTMASFDARLAAAALALGLVVYPAS